MNRARLLQKFNGTLSGIIGEDLPVLKQVKKFVIESGGKRIRPMTHYYFAKILDYSGNEWADVGAIGELIHAASLLHDDVVDEAGLRRGRPTMNAKFGNKSSILSGDYLLACGLDHLRTLSIYGRLLPIFTNVLRELSIGKLLQMQYESDLKIPDRAYERIIQCKTGSLFGAMTESAGALKNLSESEAKKYREFGEKMGRIFQVRDDFIDYFGDSSSNGKSLYQDFKRGIVTAPIIILRKSLGSKEKKELLRLWKSPEERANSRGLDNFRTMIDRHEVRKALALDIENSIHSLMHFVRSHRPTEEREEVLNSLRTLMVEA